MDALEAYAKENSLSKLKLHAQTHAEDFYKKLGYVTNSDVFMEANIPHIVMIKNCNLKTGGILLFYIAFSSAKVKC